MADKLKVMPPGGAKEEAAEEEEREDSGCPFHIGGRCSYLDRTVESLLGEDDDGGDELEEEDIHAS